MDGNSIKDAFSNKVGEIDGNRIKDVNYNIIAEVENGEIKDSYNKKVWTTEGVQQIIEGPGELTAVALWVLLIR